MRQLFCNSLLSLFMVFSSAAFTFAQTSTTSSQLTNLIDPEPLETLTLQEAVLRALEENLDITISRQTRDARLTDIVLELAQFDPTVELSTNYDRSVTPLNRPIFGLGGTTLGSEPDKIDQNNMNVRLGLTQKLYSGGNLDLHFDTNRNSVAGQTSFLFNPSYTNTLSLNLSQPLLRNFGVDVNTTQIHIARNAATTEQYVFVDQVLNVIKDVEHAYWELVFSRQNLKVAKSTLKAAKELFAANRAKVSAGVMAEVEVLQAQAGVASRVEEVLIAQKAVHDQEDQLYRLFSPSEETLQEEITVIATDRPTQKARTQTLRHELELALQKRPEILQAQKNIETGTLNTNLAKNQLLPSLAFEGNVGLSGLGKNPGDTLDRTTSRDFYNFGGGLILSYPLGNRSAQSQYNRRVLETNQAKATLQRIRHQVIIDTKEAVRRVRTDFKRIQTTRTARELAEKQLHAEQERLQLGLSTTRVVLEFQRDLAIARGNEQRAIIDYNQSLSNLRRMTATALEDYHIVLQ
ncbi:MAG: TolC family protein [Nitrospirales bacterium]|nr:TolC family protein [Nitrospira sp.]MDR4501650.1 TolC family protein [Nitrospirales bacterium]